MTTLNLIALAAALGWASGFRLYMVLFAVGLIGWFDLYPLPDGLALLQHPAVLCASGFMLLVEFFADKVPGGDSLWDAVHTFIRIPAGAALAAGVMTDSGPAMTLVAGILGGTLAAGTHFTKAGSRAVINTSPEPFSNWGASFFEDVLAVGGLWMAFVHPAVFLVLLAIAVVLMIWLLPKIWRTVMHMLRRIKAWFGTPPGRNSG